MDGGNDPNELLHALRVPMPDTTDFIVPAASKGLCIADQAVAIQALEEARPGDMIDALTEIFGY